MINNAKAGSIRLLSLAAIGMLAAAGVTACADRDDAAASVAASTDASPPGDLNRDQDSEGSGAPGWYLAEFPQHPDLDLENMAKRGAGAYMFAYTTGSTDGHELADWFRARYSENGWTIDNQQSDSRFSAVKGEAYSAVIGVNATKYVTIVSITARGGR